MDDIERQDRRLFLQEAIQFWRVFFLGGPLAALVFFASPHDPLFAALLGGPLLAWWAVGAYQDSVKRRFSSKRLEGLWKECENRLRLFDAVRQKMRKEQFADLQEMPKTVHRVGQGLYAALRRADLIAKDVQSTERELHARPPVWHSSSKDSQTQELYQLADRNIAEYRQHFQGVMAGVQRTEAQAAVFITTVDTLRMKLIGYRFAGKGPEMSHREFLSALSEAKLQLHAIDHALEELDFSTPLDPPVQVEPDVARASTFTTPAPIPPDDQTVRLNDGPPPPPPDARRP
ncbi:MAG: hypothetical protein KIS66_12835 [Fimbriimonadaceae bacterium]|nr:hypothetical protein [Fimbriimonadaceae bacterium]